MGRLRFIFPIGRACEVTTSTSGKKLELVTKLNFFLRLTFSLFPNKRLRYSDEPNDPISSRSEQLEVPPILNQDFRLQLFEAKEPTFSNSSLEVSFYFDNPELYYFRYN